MLGAAHVEIDAAGFCLPVAEPVAGRFFADEALIVARIAVAQVIPARAGPLRHGVEFARGGGGIFHPIFGFGEGRLGCAGGFEIFQFGQADG